jgi:cerevisin
MKGFYSLSVALLPLLASSSPIWVDTIHNDAAPIHSSSNAKEIPGSYIVVFKDHVKQVEAAAHHDWVQSLHLATEDSKAELRKRSQLPLMSELFEGLRHTYDIAGSLLGYSGHFDEDVIEQVRRHPDVSFPALSSTSREARARDNSVHVLTRNSLSIWR